MSSKTTVVVRDLSKTYRLTASGSEIGFKFGRNQYEVKALQGVTFYTKAGDSVGVLGRNGSGKSTLMNLIAGNEEPTSGEILVSSRPSLLSVAAALQGHLSGTDNVKLGLLAKGLRKDHVEEIYESVANWADIGDAIHRPIKTYSSGMRARLKFSIATAVKPEILLVDEALATGDKAFSDRAKARMSEFLADAGTVFVVSHSAASIQQHCNRALWLHEGNLISDGPVEEVGRLYRIWSQHMAKGNRKGAGVVVRRAKALFPPQTIVFDSEATKILDGLEQRK